MLMLDPNAPPQDADLIAIAHAERFRASNRPSDVYVPGSADRYPDELDRFQLQFHKSKHKVRMLVLGNGAGKTTTAGVEVDWWIQHNHPYRDTPKGPVQVVWICLKFQQMDLLRVQLETRCLTRGWKWNENKHRYEWPDGSTLNVFSNDGDWESAQGVPADLIVVDEEADEKLWVELSVRSRGDKKTQYVISATATKGKRWMHRMIYKPWLEHHVALGQTERQAMRTQSHLWYWVWPVGGLMDNPGNSDEDKAWQDVSLANISPQEREVRKRGGFADLNQAPVFDTQALDDVEARMMVERIAGEQGILDELPGPAAPPDRAVVPYAGGFVRRGDMMVARSRYDFLSTGGEWEGGRLTIYEHPEPDGVYVLGGDFAQGLQTGDFDAGIVCRDAGHELIQVAELHGKFGQTKIPMLLFMLGFYYNEALIVGEANSMGLGNLRWLYEAGYTYQYFRELKPDAHATPKTDRLGYFKGSPLPINKLQIELAPRSVQPVPGSITPVAVRRRPRVVIRSPHALQELRKYSWKPRTAKGELASTPDEKLVMGAEAGYHDDLVSALAGCVMGWQELPRFERPAPQYPEGSMGQRLGHEEVLRPTQQSRAFSHARK